MEQNRENIPKKLKKFTEILQVRRGSHTYGTSDQNSDEDFLSVVIPHIDRVLGLRRFKGQQIIEGTRDLTIITLHDLIKGCLSARSELALNLFVDDKDITSYNYIGFKLINDRHLLKSQQFFKPMIGFAYGQLKLTLNGNKNRFDPRLGYDPKSAYHAIRVLYTGYKFKVTGVLESMIRDETFTQICLDVKHGLWSKKRVVGQISRLISKFDEADCHPSIPKKVNEEYWNEFVIQAYCDMLMLKRR